MSFWGRPRQKKPKTITLRFPCGDIDPAVKAAFWWSCQGEEDAPGKLINKFMRSVLENELGKKYADQFIESMRETLRHPR